MSFIASKCYQSICNFRLRNTKFINLIKHIHDSVFDKLSVLNVDKRQSPMTGVCLVIDRLLVYSIVFLDGWSSEPLIDHLFEVQEEALVRLFQCHKSKERLTGVYRGLWLDIVRENLEILEKFAKVC